MSLRVILVSRAYTTPSVTPPVVQGYKSIFEDAVKASEIANDKEKTSVMINFAVTSLNPSVRFTIGFLGGDAVARCDIAITTNVLDMDNQEIMTSIADGSGAGNNSSGSACEGGATAIATAVDSCMKAALEKTAYNPVKLQLIWFTSLCCSF